MTISQALARAYEQLSRSRPAARGATGRSENDPHLEAEILLSDILNKPRSYLLARGETLLTENQINDYESRLAHRLNGEPVAYITGYKQFYGLDFEVNKHVLIPRGETELMVDEGLSFLRDPDAAGMSVVDVGTGSGCVIISVAKNSSPSGNVSFYATDISRGAIDVARKNAEKYNLQTRIKFFCGNLLEPVLTSKTEKRKSKIMILANLPYLTPAQIKNSPTIRHEPRLALSAGADGLKCYRQLFQQIKMLHDIRYVLCEIDPSQTIKIKQLIKHELPGAKIQIKKDLRGQNRLVVISDRMIT